MKFKPAIPKEKVKTLEFPAFNGNQSNQKYQSNQSNLIEKGKEINHIHSIEKPMDINPSDLMDINPSDLIDINHKNQSDLRMGINNENNNELIENDRVKELKYMKSDSYIKQDSNETIDSKVKFKSQPLDEKHESKLKQVFIMQDNSRIKNKQKSDLPTLKIKSIEKLQLKELKESVKLNIPLPPIKDNLSNRLTDQFNNQMNHKINHQINHQMNNMNNDLPLKLGNKNIKTLLQKHKKKATHFDTEETYILKLLQGETKPKQINHFHPKHNQHVFEKKLSLPKINGFSIMQ